MVGQHALSACLQVKPGGEDDTSDRCAAIQNNLDRLKKLAHRNIIMFNRGER